MLPANKRATAASIPNAYFDYYCWKSRRADGKCRYRIDYRDSFTFSRLSHHLCCCLLKKIKKNKTHTVYDAGETKKMASLYFYISNLKNTKWRNRVIQKWVGGKRRKKIKQLHARNLNSFSSNYTLCRLVVLPSAISPQHVITTTFVRTVNLSLF